MAGSLTLPPSYSTVVSRSQLAQQIFEQGKEQVRDTGMRTGYAAASRLSGGLLGFDVVMFGSHSYSVVTSRSDKVSIWMLRR